MKLAATAADRFRKPAPGVVVLAYHRVGGTSALEIDLDAGLFDEQMAALAAARTITTLGAALERLSYAPEQQLDSAIAVTFDDGTADFADVAVPILVRHGIPVTLYLATSFVEDGREFPGGGVPLSWPALADACTTGLVDVGSHTHRHLLLDRVARVRKGREECEIGCGHRPGLAPPGRSAHQ